MTRRAGAPRCWLTAASLLASACVAPSGPHSPHPFLDRFAAALTFVPQGVDSVWLITDPSETFQWDSTGDAPRLEVRCGRDLSWPGWSQLQLFEGVRIQDYGESGVSTARRDQLGAPTGRVDDQSVWQRPARKIGLGQDVPATCTVIVDERFVVIADSEALLKDALARRGGEGAATLLDLVDVPPQAVELMVHRFQPPPRRPDRKPSPPWLAMVRTTAPVAYEWWGPATAPNLPGTPIHETRRGSPVWRWPQVDGEEARMEQSAMWQLQVALTFGLMIFI